VIVAWTWGEPQKKTRSGSAPHAQTRRVRTPQAATRRSADRHARSAARAGCEVHSGSATGTILFQGTLERGQRSSSRRKLWITLDRPENLARS
jgi:hypothetical protein